MQPAFQESERFLIYVLEEALETRGRDPLTETKSVTCGSIVPNPKHHMKKHTDFLSEGASAAKEKNAISTPDS